MIITVGVGTGNGRKGQEEVAKGIQVIRAILIVGLRVCHVSDSQDQIFSTDPNYILLETHPHWRISCKKECFLFKWPGFICLLYDST